MFQHDMKESVQGLVAIKDFEAPVVKEMLRFCYSGQVEKSARVGTPFADGSWEIPIDTPQERMWIGANSANETEGGQRLRNVRSGCHLPLPPAEGEALDVFKKNRGRFDIGVDELHKSLAKYPDLVLELILWKKRITSCHIIMVHNRIKWSILVEKQFVDYSTLYFSSSFFVKNMCKHLNWECI